MIVTTPWTSTSWPLIPLISILVRVPSPFVRVLVVTVVVVVVVIVVVSVGVVVTSRELLTLSIWILPIETLEGFLLVIPISVLLLLLLSPFQS